MDKLIGNLEAVNSSPYYSISHPTSIGLLCESKKKAIEEKVYEALDELKPKTTSLKYIDIQKTLKNTANIGDCLSGNVQYLDQFDTAIYMLEGELTNLVKEAQEAITIANNVLSYIGPLRAASKKIKEFQKVIDSGN